jgi:hypothetical protein
VSYLVACIFFIVQYKLILQKRFKLKIDSVGKRKREKDKGKTRGSLEYNKAAVLLPYLVWGLFELCPE